MLIPTSTSIFIIDAKNRHNCADFLHYNRRMPAFSHSAIVVASQMLD